MHLICLILIEFKNLGKELSHSSKKLSREGNSLECARDNLAMTHLIFFVRAGPLSRPLSGIYCQYKLLNKHLHEPCER